MAHDKACSFNMGSLSDPLGQRCNCGDAQPPAPDLLAAAKALLKSYRSPINHNSIYVAFSGKLMVALERAVAAAEAVQNIPNTGTNIPTSNYSDPLGVQAMRGYQQQHIADETCPEVSGSKLPPIRLTERRDPLSADTRLEYNSDFD